MSGWLVRLATAAMIQAKDRGGRHNVGMRRDRIMQLMGLAFGLSVAMPVAGRATGDEPDDMVIVIDLTEDEPAVHIDLSRFMIE